MRDIPSSLADLAAEQYARLDGWLFGGRQQIHAVAALRVLLGLSVLGLLWADFANRGVIAGPGSVWIDEVRALSRFPEVGLLSGVSDDVLTVVYVLVLAAAVAFTLGWRTKGATLVLLIGYTAVMGQNPLTASAVDDLIRLSLLWMLLMDPARVWSLDARRRGRARRAARAVPDWLAAGLHNIGLIGLGIQVAAMYTAAGFDKLAHPHWRDGTALAYTLRLPENRPIEFLADLFVSATVLGILLTYAVLGLQVYFAPLLIHRVSRIAVIVFAAGLNLFLAVLFARVAESLALIAVTLLFLPDDLVLDRVEAAAFSRPVQRLVDLYYTVSERLLIAADWLRYDLPDRLRALFGR